MSAELSNPFYPALIDPVHDELAQRGFRTILVTDRGYGPVEIEPLIDGSLDGVILTTTELDSDLPRELSHRGLPFVLLNRDTHDVGYDVCVVNNAEGVRQIAKLLIELGHTRIGAIFGPENTSTGLERRQAFLTEMARHGIFPCAGTIFSGPFTPETGIHGFHYVWRSKPTAIFCANDVIALGACNAAASVSLSVPEDVTIMGFDNIPMSGWELFGLTTVGVSIQELASSAVHLLARRMEDPQRPAERVLLEPQLELRASHGVPRTSLS